jgi:hypothetical protein
MGFREDGREQISGREDVPKKKYEDKLGGLLKIHGSEGPMSDVEPMLTEIEDLADGSDFNGIASFYSGWTPAALRDLVAEVRGLIQSDEWRAKLGEIRGESAEEMNLPVNWKSQVRDLERRMRTGEHLEGRLELLKKCLAMGAEGRSNDFDARSEFGGWSDEDIQNLIDLASNDVD